jgi:hypothetical protein
LRDVEFMKQETGTPDAVRGTREPKHTQWGRNAQRFETEA